ncbi:MAG: HAD family hydrolase, partial [Eubacteriales bacterium]
LLDGVYISSEAGMRKPEPAFLERLLKAEGLAPGDCVLVGNDLSTDMAVAAACGVKGIFLNTDGLTEKEIAHGFQSLVADYNADLEAIPSGSLALLLTK